MPAERFYSRAHAWVQPERENVVRVGLDDLAAHLVGAADRIEMPEPGQHLRRGRPALRLVRGGEAVDVPAPLDGEVVVINQAVVDAPSTFAALPYDEGWLLELRPQVSEENLSGLMFGDNARRWQRGEAERLTRLFRGKTDTAADGATLAHDAMAGIPGVRWSKMLRKFLRGGARRA
jgi:glycine cleavage system H lipoate-binding protein